MVIFLQHTITDLRGFTDLSDTVLLKPSWPTPSSNDFVRYCGAAMPRKNLGINNWITENFLCKLKNVLRITPFTYSDDTLSYPLKIKNVDVHQYSTEKLVLTKYEFVFVVDTIGDFVVDQAFLKRVIGAILHHTVSIKHRALPFKQTSISALNRHLSIFLKFVPVNSRSFRE
jgi:hypothetical protein